MTTEPVEWRAASIAEVRELIARSMLDGHTRAAPPLGQIVLRPHQRAAADRLRRLLEVHGGAMLAEPVGVGKTYTALAVASGEAGSLLVVAPAALRGMWQDALVACGLTASIVTHEALSRGVRPPVGPSFVIVDEAHRVRSPATRRYALLADVCRRSTVLLLTATPVQNRSVDLAAQLALFLGRSAWQLTEEELARYVVRDAESGAEGRPRLDGPHLIELTVCDDCLDQILALPPSVPARDESVAHTLLTYGMVHQWTSSRAALGGALRRRRARGLALLAALDTGRLPSRSELTAWAYADDSLQLAFSELVTSVDVDHDRDAFALRVALEQHVAALAALLERMKRDDDPDAERVAVLRRIRSAHPGERIIAFCQYTETVNALRARMGRDAGIAALTAEGARVASGRIRRDDVLAQFTVRPAGSPVVRDAERIDLLITTDLLSEGLNLQEASVIVHLDLPWNPARLDQRVGRALRLGSRHSVVTVYTLSPPADAERLLQIERRLREKLSVAQRTVGVAGRILPSALALRPPMAAAVAARPLKRTSVASATPLPVRGFAEEASAATAELRRWLEVGGATGRGDAPVHAGASGRARGRARVRVTGDVPVSAVWAECGGLLALVRDGNGQRLVADLGQGLDDGAATVNGAIAVCSGAATDGAVADRPIDALVDLCVAHTVGPALDPALDPAVARRAIIRLTAWIAARPAAQAIDFQAASAARARRSALARLAQTLARAPRHRRPVLAPLVEAVRAVATAPLGEGAERILETLVGAQLPDEAWLRSIAAFGELNTRRRSPREPADDIAGAATEPPAILAVILMIRKGAPP